MYFNKKYLVVLFLSSLFMLIAWTPNVHADNYTVPLTVLKDGTGQTSYAASYFSNSANVVDIGDGTYVVTSTITTDKKLGNFPVQILSIDGGGANVSQADNGDSQTVTYSYQTNDLTERHNAVIKVDVDNIDYHHTYNVGLQLDASSIPASDAEKSSSESSEDDQNEADDADKNDQSEAASSDTQSSDSASVAAASKNTENNANTKDDSLKQIGMVIGTGLGLGVVGAIGTIWFKSRKK